MRSLCAGRGTGLWQTRRNIHTTFQTVHCAWGDALGIACNTIQGSDASEILQYLHDQGVRFSEKEMTDLLQRAGVRYRREVDPSDDNFQVDTKFHYCTKWLREHGASWPDVLGCDDGWGDRDEWSPAAAAWARTEGCTHPIW